LSGLDDFSPKKLGKKKPPAMAGRFFAIQFVSLSFVKPLLYSGERSPMNLIE
jgi:hypothetical protein